MASADDRPPQHLSVSVFDNGESGIRRCSIWSYDPKTSLQNSHSEVAHVMVGKTLANHAVRPLLLTLLRIPA